MKWYKDTEIKLDQKFVEGVPIDPEPEKGEYFTVDGIEEDSDSKTIVARNVAGICQVKFSNERGLLNPWGHLYNKGDENKCIYRRVSKGVFDLYIRFLKTRNVAHLKNAERIM